MCEKNIEDMTPQELAERAGKLLDHLEEDYKRVCEERDRLLTRISELGTKLEDANKRIKSEEEIRLEITPDVFVESDIDYLCMLASHGRCSVQPGWLKTFAKKIRATLDKIEQLEKD